MTSRPPAQARPSRTDDLEDLPLGERAYLHIRQAIQTHQLKPGDRLREVDLAKTVGLSRTPIREALARLETEGLIVHDPIRGIQVAELDYEMTTELYFIREVLEGTAARLAAQHASDIEISILNELCEQYAVATDQAMLSLRNRQFHDTLYRCSHNRYLIKSLTTLHDTLMLFGSSTLEDPKRVKATILEHRAVVDAVRARDPAQAEAAMRKHIHAAQEMRLRALFKH
jgi:DNA-binding GntR family transcriptional regulator